MMKLTAFSLVAMQVIGVAAARAQTASELQVSVYVVNTTTDGAEVPAGGSFGTGPVSEKHSGGARFSVRPCGAFSIEAGLEGPFQDASTTGWRVELTPIGMESGAATFRLRWIRALESGMQMSPKNEDIELTMRPGESRPLDSVPVPPDKQTGRPCPITDNRGRQVELTRVGLRVSVDYTPRDADERRLMAADLWLIERLPDGTERTQAQAVRGFPHREMPFFFDALTEGGRSLEVFGQALARPYGQTIAVQLGTRSRWGPAAFDWRDGKSQIRYVDSRLELKPGETVEVALPRLEPSAGPFANRKYAIRIRVRQLR